MTKTAEERGHFRGTFRTSSGFKVSVSFERDRDGRWKIFSIGGASIPTAFLPYGISSLVFSDLFERLDDAKLAVKIS